MQFGPTFTSTSVAGAGPGGISASTDGQVTEGSWGGLTDFGPGKGSVSLSSLLPDGHPKGSWASEPEFVFTFPRTPGIVDVLSQDGEMQQFGEWAGRWAIEQVTWAHGDHRQTGSFYSYAGGPDAQ